LPEWPAELEGALAGALEGASLPAAAGAGGLLDSGARGAGAAGASEAVSGKAGCAGAPSAAALLARGLRVRFSTGASTLPVSEGVFSDKCVIPRWNVRAPGRAAN